MVGISSKLNISGGWISGDRVSDAVEKGWRTTERKCAYFYGDHARAAREIPPDDVSLDRWLPHAADPRSIDQRLHA